MRPKGIADAIHQARWPGHNKVYGEIPEGQPTAPARLRFDKQKKHVYRHQEGRYNLIKRKTTGTCSIKRRTYDADSVSGKGSDQVDQDQPKASKSAFDPLRDMPEDRQYVLQRFLAEDPSLTGVVDETARASSHVQEKSIGFEYPLPKARRASLDTSLLMIGAFAEDFIEYCSFYYTTKMSPWLILS